MSSQPREKNLLEQFFKWKRSHVFSRKQKLAKIQKIERLLTSRELSLLSVFTSSGQLKLALDGCVELCQVDIKEHIQAESSDLENCRVAVTADLACISLLIPYSDTGDEGSRGFTKLALFGLDCSKLSNT